MARYVVHFSDVLNEFEKTLFGGTEFSIQWVRLSNHDIEICILTDFYLLDISF